MLLVNETLAKFGYDPTTISGGSDKMVIVKCDYCENIKEMKNNARTCGLKSFPKDACSKCGGKKRKESLLEKYGVETTQALPHVKEKTKKTNLEKFGSETFFGSEKGSKKAKEGMIKKYGVDHNMKVKEIKAAKEETIKKTYGVDNVFKLSSFQELAYKKRIEMGSIKTFNGKTIKQIAKEKSYAYSSMVERINKLGYDMATFAVKQESYLEILMSKILDDINVAYIKQFRVNNKIADFKIIDSNLLIEADGLYWHSDASDKPYDYHLSKKELYQKNNYRAMFFREDEIIDRPRIIQSIICNTLKLNKNKFFARKLLLKEVAFQESRDFVEQNHLMGSINSITCSFGLYDGHNLVSIIQMKRTKNNDYDISRFCNKLGHSVVGGFTRLLSAFKNKYKPDSISTFIDRRYGSGEYLESLGFKFISCSPSFSWTDGQNTYHRLRFRGNSGYEHGLNKIWDCGQARYVY